MLALHLIILVVISGRNALWSVFTKVVYNLRSLLLVEVLGLYIMDKKKSSSAMEATANQNISLANPYAAN